MTNPIARVLRLAPPATQHASTHTTAHATTHAASSNPATPHRRSTSHTYTRSSIVPHVRIDRHTTNELLESKESTYQPINEPRNSTVQAMGLLERGETMVHGLPIAATRQYSTPPLQLLPDDLHMRYISSMLPDPAIHVHSEEDVSHVAHNTPVYDILNPIHHCQLQHQHQHDSSIAKSAGCDVVKQAKLDDEENSKADASTKQRCLSPSSSHNAEQEGDHTSTSPPPPLHHHQQHDQQQISTTASLPPSKTVHVHDDNDSLLASCSAVEVS